MTFFEPHGRPSADPGLAAMQHVWRREWLTLHEDIFDHAHFDPEAAAALDRYIESQEHLELKTVGIDIGSSTSHLLFAKIILEREAQELSSRYVIVRRDIVWRSPIMLTPFTKTGTIDAAALGAFIEKCYEDAGVTPDAIDSGAVILTGEAIKKTNAEAIDELFAAQAGKFVIGICNGAQVLRTARVPCATRRIPTRACCTSTSAAEPRSSHSSRAGKSST